MPQFDATIKHIKEGIKGFTVSAAVKNIEGWEAHLEKVETSGVKAITGDLKNLKKELQADEINSEKVKQILVKLGKDTVNLAGKAEGDKAEKIKNLGESVSKMADAKN